MFKSTLVCLLFFVGMVLGGLLLSNLVLLLQLLISSRLEEGITNLDQAISVLGRHELLIQQMIAQIFSLILPSFILFRVCPALGSIKRNPDLNLALAFQCTLILLFSIPLVGLSSFINHMIPFPDWVYDSEDRMTDLMRQFLVFDSPTDFLLALLIIAVIPALAEEIAFRGVLQNLMQRATGSAIWGIVISSVIFSTVHMQFLGFIPRLLLGLLLGYFYFRTANLWYSILIHFLNNAGQLFAIYIAKGAQLDELLDHPKMPNLFMVACSTLASMYPIWLFHQKTLLTRHDQA